MTISQEWWDRWWEEDYSWDGLAEKDWRGWVVPDDGVPVPREAGVKGRQATLQDYWRRAGLAEDIERPEFCCPKTGRCFTRVHLPLVFRGGSQTLKGRNDDAFTVELNAVLKAELARPIAENKHHGSGILARPDNRLQWSGAVLLNLSLHNLSAQTQSADSRISVSLNAMNAAFSGDAHFNSAAFVGDARFDGAIFSRDAYFHGAAFLGDAHFDGVDFCERAIFSRAAFSALAVFNRVAFLRDAEFGGAAFSVGAFFESAAFSRDASFRGAAFSEYSSFDGAAFAGEANFGGAVFLNAVEFSGQGRSLISEVVDQSIALTSLFGDGGTAFEGHLTGEPALLPIARRSVQRFIAKGAVFLGPVDFSNRDILSGSERVESDFHNAYFFHLFKLHGSVLHRGINFGETHVEIALDRGKTKESCLPMPDALIAGLITLRRAVPKKPMPPEEGARRWEKSYYANISAKWFALYEGDLEAFQDWRRSEAKAFAEGPTEHRIEYFRALEDCYRALKQFNEDRRDRPEEGRFHRLELIARRRRRRPKYTALELLAFWRQKEGIPIWERVLSHIYGASSNYGNSVVLPIGWLLGGVFVFALAYMLMGDWFLDRPSWKHFGEALSFSFGQVLPFGPWDTPGPCTSIGQMLDPLTAPAQEVCKQHLGDGFEARAYRDGTPIGLRLLASFQSLSAIILVFLSGLAIRRRFQIN